METHREMATSIGTDKYGIDEITNHCMIVTGDHIGTPHRLVGPREA